MNDQLQRVIIAKGITFRGTGIRFKPPTDSPVIPKEQKVYVANGGIIPSPTISQIAPEEKVPILEVKEEPLDEEEPASSPVKESESNSNAPENFPDASSIQVKEEEPEHESPEEQPCSSSAPSTSTSTPNPAKRARKMARKTDFIYGDPMEAPLRQPEQFEFSEHVEHDEPVERRRKSASCRCEYIVPELEKRMGGIMDKMSVIESLAQSLLNRNESRDADHKIQMMNANNEITLLRRQLVIERNEKNLKKRKEAKIAEDPPNLQRQQ